MNTGELIVAICLTILALSVVLALIRFFMGPRLTDRVIALDLMITIGISMIAAYSIFTNQPLYLDNAMIMALLAFMGTIAFAYYLERRGEK